MFQRVTVSFILILAIFLLAGCNTSSVSSTPTTDTSQSTTATTEKTTPRVTETPEEVKLYMPEGYDVMFYGVIDTPFVLSHNIKTYNYYEENNNKFLKEDATFKPPETITVSANGKTYSASLETHSKYSYQDEDGNSFFINTRCELTSMRLRDVPIIEQSVTQKECEQNAIEFLSKILDVSNYKVVSTVETTTLDSPSYHFTFQKYFGEIPVYDTVSVYVRYDGYVLEFFSNNRYRIPNDLELPPIDMDKVNAAIDYTFYSLRNNETNKERFLEIKFSVIEDPSIVVFNSDEIGFVCEIKVTYRPKQGQGLVIGGSIQTVDGYRLLVKIPQK